MNVDSRLTAKDAVTRLSLLHDYLSNPLREASAPFFAEISGQIRVEFLSVDREMVYM